MIVGSALQWVGIAASIIVLASPSRATFSTVLKAGTHALTLGLWIQSALGHMPFPTGTVVHVPLGSLLVAGSFALAVASLRQPRGAQGPPADATDR